MNFANTDGMLLSFYKSLRIFLLLIPLTWIFERRLIARNLILICHSLFKTLEKLDLALEEVKKLYNDFYKGQAFTFVADDVIDLKQVVNTNKCLIGLEKEKSKLVAHSAIDNLLKGASGQAVQNMNLMFGFEEEAGLRLKSIVF